MRNLWEIWPGALSEEYCNYVVEKGKKHQPVKATVGFEGGNKEDKEYRSSTIRWMDVVNADADIAQTLMHFIKRSNRTNFGFDITNMNEIQFTEYFGTENGHYDWHHDVHWENAMPFDRKLSIVVQLSHPDEYEGGEFEFFGCPSPPKDQWSKKGSVLIFPSFFHHRVLPVTKGHRISLVSWIEGPKFR